VRLHRAADRLDPERRRIGVEHELQLFDRTGQLDARQLLSSLAIAGRRLDPGDPQAIRCEWGGVITADGYEVEVVTPPSVLDADGVAATVYSAARGAAVLGAALPGGTTWRGYSTHLNVEVDDRRCRQIARSIAERLSVAMMLVLDGRDSPGLLVRPRHRRVELGGEYQAGSDLHPALVVAAGIVLLAERLCTNRRAGRDAPPRLELRIVPSPQRFGWYVDRRAGGADLYGEGRRTVLRTSRGRHVTAQAALEQIWSASRPLLDRRLSDEDLAVVDHLVDGSAPLPCERDDEPSCGPIAPPANARRTDVLTVRRRADVSVAAEAATWHAVVFRAVGNGTSRWITVPGERVDAFLSAMDDGRLDHWLGDHLGGHARRESVGRGA
jgi:hypothetical protein